MFKINPVTQKFIILPFQSKKTFFQRTMQDRTFVSGYMLEYTLELEIIQNI